jgi:hypothetical protein
MNPKNFNRSEDSLKNKFTYFLALAVIVQLFILARFVSSWGVQIFEMKDYSPIQKSALTTWTAGFSEYIVFLRETIPDDARVILPPNAFSPPIDNVGYMQYLLFPREIHNCGPDEIDACVLRADGPSTYILSSPEFPPRELAERSKALIESVEGFGVYVPIPQE